MRITRLCPLLLPLLLPLFLPAPAPAAPASAPPERVWEEGAAARALLEPWSRCPDLYESLQSDGDYQVRARAARGGGGGVEVELYDHGAGYWASQQTQVYSLRPGSCRGRGFSMEGHIDTPLGGFRRRAIGDAPLPSLRAAAAIAEAVLVESPNSAELAGARMLVQLARLEDAPLPVQPAHSGRPRGSPAAVWTRAKLDAAGVIDPWGDDDDEPFDGIYTGRVRPPTRTRTEGRWEIWELHFRSRIHGGLVAIYDRRARRHRWVWGAEAGEFQTAFVGDRIELRVEFDDQASRWSIDPVSGKAELLETATLPE